VKDYHYHFEAAEDCLQAAFDGMNDSATMLAKALAHATLANAAANHLQAEADARTASAVSVGDHFAEGRLQVGGVRA